MKIENDKWYEFIKSVNDNYILHRVLFLMNIPILIKVPVRILFLHQPTDTIELFSWLCGACYIVVCWNNFKWNKLFGKDSKK